MSKTKKGSRVTALVLSLAMLSTFAIGCDKTDNQAQSSGGTTSQSTSSQDASQTESTLNPNINLDSTFPVVKDPVEVEIAVIAALPNTDQNRMWFWKWAEKKTNVTVEPVQIESSAWEERKQLMFATDQLPDAFLHCTFTNAELLSFGQIEGSLIALNDYLDYAPNFKAALEADPLLKANVTAPDGNIYSVPTVMQVSNTKPYRFFVNADWLEKAGMDMPKNLDEFYKVLKYFKENDMNGNGDPNDEIPWSGSWEEGYYERALIINAMGFSTTNSNSVIDPETDTAVYFPLHPKYRDYLKYMNKLWEEGLLDPDIFTQTQVQYQAKAASNLIGAAADSASYIIYPEDYTAFEPIWALSETEGGTPTWPQDAVSSNGSFVITKNAKNPDVLMKWVDMFFTAEGAIRFWNGPEKDSEDDIGSVGAMYNENGQRYHDLPQDINNEWEYNCKVLSPINGRAVGYYSNDAFWTELGLSIPPAAENDAFWQDLYLERNTPYAKPMYPNVFYSEDEQRTINEISMPLEDYVKNMEAKFIIGAESIDSGYDKFIQQIKVLRAEEYQDILISAYETYKSNK